MWRIDRIAGRGLLAVVAWVVATTGGCLLPPLEQSNPSPDSSSPSGDIGMSDSGGGSMDSGGGSSDGEGSSDGGGSGVTAGQVAEMMGNHCTQDVCHGNETFPPTLPKSPKASDVKNLIGKESTTDANMGAVYITRGNRDESLIYNQMADGAMPKDPKKWGSGEFTVVDRSMYESDEAAGQAVAEKIGKWIDNL
ncbi:MAG: hypothetical protein ABEN55_18715 [Bradymonadaceae bacterium]